MCGLRVGVGFEGFEVWLINRNKMEFGLDFRESWLGKFGRKICMFECWNCTRELSQDMENFEII